MCFEHQILFFFFFCFFGQFQPKLSQETCKSEGEGGSFLMANSWLQKAFVPSQVSVLSHSISFKPMNKMERCGEKCCFSGETLSFLCNFCLSFIVSWESFINFTLHMQTLPFFWQIVCWDMSDLSTGVRHKYLSQIRYKKLVKHNLDERLPDLF